jgi:hypothetical protein
VLLTKNAVSRVQDEPVQAIFKPIRVKKTQYEAAEDPGERMRKKPEGNPYEDGAGQECGHQVVSFDSQPLGFCFGPNYIIGNHPEDKLARSLNCRKHRNQETGASHEHDH